jgi:hypothetical protein
MEAKGQLHAQAALLLGRKAPGIYWIGGWMDPRAGQVTLEERKILPLPGMLSSL